MMEDEVSSPGTADDHDDRTQRRGLLRGSSTAADAGGRGATGSPPGKRTDLVEDGSHRRFKICKSVAGFKILRTAQFPRNFELGLFLAV